MSPKHEYEWSKRRRAEPSVQARTWIVEGMNEQAGAIGGGFILILIICIAAIVSFFKGWAPFSLILKLSAGAAAITVLIFGWWWVNGVIKTDMGREQEWIEDGGSSDEFLKK